MRANPLLILCFLATAFVIAGCGDSDECSCRDGNVEYPIGNTREGDMPDDDDPGAVLTDGEVIDGDTNDGEVVDGDAELDNEQFFLCHGACNPQTYPLTCINDMNLCVCIEDGDLELLNCNEICIEADYPGSTECSGHPDTNMDTCYCYESECVSNSDCSDLGDDYVCLFGFCQYRKLCDLSLCQPTVGCMDVGVGEGRGICFMEDEPVCSSPGEDCSENQDGSRFCSDLCALTDAACYQSCEAIPNSCDEGELCFPLSGDAQGNIVSGVCIDHGADCPDVPADGDPDSDEDQEIAEFETD